MKFIFLDDERVLDDVTWVPYDFPSDDLFDNHTIVRNFISFVKEVNKIKTQEDMDNTIFSFDHDLADFVNKHDRRKAIEIQELLQTDIQKAKDLFDEYNQNKFETIEELLENHLNEKYKLQMFSNSISEYNGLSCVNYLIDYCLDKGLKLTNSDNFYFHTQNLQGERNMSSKINNFIKFCEEKNEKIS